MGARPSPPGVHHRLAIMGLVERRVRPRLSLTSQYSTIRTYSYTTRSARCLHGSRPVGGRKSHLCAEHGWLAAVWAANMIGTTKLKVMEDEDFGSTLGGVSLASLHAIDLYSLSYGQQDHPRP